MPHARPSSSVACSSGATKLSQLTCVCGASSCVTTARLCASSVSMAGVTCSALMASKRGRPEKSSRGFWSVISYPVLVSLTAVLAGALGCFHRVHQQHGDGHRAHAARYWRDVRGDFFHTGEIDIAAQLARVIAVHADVDYDGA